MLNDTQIQYKKVDKLITKKNNYYVTNINEMRLYFDIMENYTMGHL